MTPDFGSYFSNVLIASLFAAVLYLKTETHNISLFTRKEKIYAGGFRTVQERTLYPKPAMVLGRAHEAHARSKFEGGNLILLHDAISPTAHDGATQKFALLHIIGSEYS